MNNDLKKLQVKFVVGIIIIVLVYVLFTIISDIEKITSIFSTIMIHSYLVPIIILFSSSLTLRGFIQKQILKQLGIDLSFRESLSLYFAGLSMLITPFGMGQTIKSHFLKEQYEIPYAKSIPLVLAERLYDFIFIIIFLWFSTIFVFGNESLYVTIFSTILLILIITCAKNKSINNFVKYQISKFQFFKKKLSSYEELSNSISLITQYKKILKILPLVFVAFTIETIVIHLGFMSFQIDSTYFESIQIFYSSILLGIFSFLPGGVGITEGSFITFLTNDDVSFSLASSLIIFLRLVTIWSVSIVGFIFTFRFLRSLKNN